jgi:hypothetical protein
MSPRVVPKTDGAPLKPDGAVVDAKHRVRMMFAGVNPYGSRSEHSWVLDSALAKQEAPDPNALERLLRFREWSDRPEAKKELRATSSSTLGGLIPATIPPWVNEAVAYGVRSGAPLALALERLDLPPVGMSAAWAKVTTGATVTNQSAENSALTASSDVAVSSATDALKTIGAYADFSAQSRELSGGWLDLVLGEELGRAFGARLEAQIWQGNGGSSLTGFENMTGNSSSTVAGQTLANITAKIQDQYQQVFANLGAAPDILAMHPRRYANLMQGCNALGLAFDDAVADGLAIVPSPGASTNKGAGTNEDWLLLVNRSAVPLVRDPNPSMEFHQEGPSAGQALTFRWVIYAYVALGVSRRPEGAGLVKGATSPAF